MDVLNYLRKEIKEYYPESKELQLSGFFANQRRFNFYFEIAPEERHLLYLSWDGDYDRFTLKSLEFSSQQVLIELINVYPQTGSKSFNIGKPVSTVSFECRAQGQLTALEFIGLIHFDKEVKTLSGQQLMQSVDPRLTE
jgi:hypothetical protein